MELRIKAINFEASEQLKTFIDKKVKKISRFNDNIIESEEIGRASCRGRV